MSPARHIATVLLAPGLWFAPSAHGQADKLRELETAVWTSPDQALPDIERRVVKELQLAPRSELVHYLLSHTYVRLFTAEPSRLDYLSTATDLAGQAVALAPRSEAGYLATADVLDMMGEHEEARRILDRALEAGIQPSWRFHFTRARMLAVGSHVDAVLERLRYAMDAEGSNRDVVAPYVIAVMELHWNQLEMMNSLKRWNEQYPHPQFQQMIALNLAVAEKDYEAAHRLYHEIYHDDPDALEAQINDAILLREHLGRSAEAIALLERVLAAPKSQLPPAMKALAHAHLGAAYLTQRKLSPAEDQFVQTIALAPEARELVDFVVERYLTAGDALGLVTLLERVNDEVPGIPYIYRVQGEFYSTRLGQPWIAIQYLANAILLDPTDSGAYDALGLGLYRAELLAESLMAFEQAVNLDPENAGALYNKACVLTLLGKPREALIHLRRALSLKPELAAVALHDQDFAALQGDQEFNDIVQSFVAGLGAP